MIWGKIPHKRIKDIKYKEKVKRLLPGFRELDQYGLVL